MNVQKTGQATTPPVTARDNAREVARQQANAETRRRERETRSEAGAAAAPAVPLRNPGTERVSGELNRQLTQAQASKTAEAPRPARRPDEARNTRDTPVATAPPRNEAAEAERRADASRQSANAEAARRQPPRTEPEARPREEAQNAPPKPATTETQTTQYAVANYQSNQALLEESGKANRVSARA